MKTVRCATLVLLWIALIAPQLSAGDTPAAADKHAGKQTVRLLAIGNSFTHDATTYLASLAEADGNRLVLKLATVGGGPLQIHWDKAQQHERNPQQQAGLYRNGQGLKEMLLDGPHDFVTIQQRSYISHDAATYRPYAANLQAYVRKHAPQAELLLHETWAYRVDDPRFSAATKSGSADDADAKSSEPRTQRQMYQQVADAYRTIAKELGVRIIPVGDAFFAADSDPKWGYRPDLKFDFQHAKPPTLPDQSHSLHAGARWSKNAQGEPQLGMDGHHASKAGRYLAGCVWYEVLFERSCVDNSFTAGLDADYARFLQSTAHQAVTK